MLGEMVGEVARCRMHCNSRRVTVTTACTSVTADSLLSDRRTQRSLLAKPVEICCAGLCDMLPKSQVRRNGCSEVAYVSLAVTVSEMNCKARPEHDHPTTRCIWNQRRATQSQQDSLQTDLVPSNCKCHRRKRSVYDV